MNGAVSGEGWTVEAEPEGVSVVLHMDSDDLMAPREALALAASIRRAAMHTVAFAGARQGRPVSITAHGPAFLDTGEAVDPALRFAPDGEAV